MGEQPKPNVDTGIAPKEKPDSSSEFVPQKELLTAEETDALMNFDTGIEYPEEVQAMRTAWNELQHLADRVDDLDEKDPRREQALKELKKIAAYMQEVKARLQAIIEDN